MKMLTLISSFVVVVLSEVGPVCATGPDSPALNPEYLGALRSGDVAQIKRVLDSGASPNARDAAGTTALMRAAVYGDLSAMALLIERGADVDATNTQGATALMRAAFDAKRVALLLNHGANVNVRSALGNSALILAARPANSHAAVQLLLEHGADAKATNNFGGSALMAAAAGGDAEAVRLLLDHGADANVETINDPQRMGFILGGGRTALMWAAYRGDTQIIKELIKAGADVNARSALGTPLSQAAWSDSTAAARLLIEHGAKVDLAGPADGYTALHWATSSERTDPALVQLLLNHGADPNLGGGEPVDAFMGTLQTPLMLARRRGETPILASLVQAGATNATPDRVPPLKKKGTSSEQSNAATIRAAVNQALPPLERTAIESKPTFLHHASRQDCTSCHQQYLPMTATGMARKQGASVDAQAEQQLISMVRDGIFGTPEVDWQVLFHPEPVHTKGYAALALAAEDLAPTENTDSWVHHLAVIQGKDGQWYNNLPRPPIQTSDVGATALAVYALQRYSLPGRQAEFSARVDRARNWLRKVKPAGTEERIYQILGLAWAAEPAAALQPQAKALAEIQRPDGGWAQLPGLTSDAYATGQAIYALRVGARLDKNDPAIDRGLRYLLRTQLEDGTWFVQRRAFPFQPTMDSGFPHGRDSWISAAASSWAVMALSLPDKVQTVAENRR
jgi:ankyrin repeat protein